jgi:chromate transporter
MAIVWALAWACVRHGQAPQVVGLLYRVKPVIIAVVVQVLWGLGRSALKGRGLVFAGLACVVLNAAGLDELAVLFGARAPGAATGWGTPAARIRP